MKAIVRLTIPLALLTFMLILTARSIGGDLPGEHVAAFTLNSYKTRSMYVYDGERGINFYIEFTGHENELPVWSTETRGVVFYPRNQLSEPPVKP